MTDTELALRLEMLEQDNRRLKRFAFGTIVLLAALAGIYATQPVPDVITSHKFVVLDKQGRARVTISTPEYAGTAVETNADDPAIWLSDDKGTDRAILTDDGLRFADAKGKPLATYAPTDPVLHKITAREFDVVDNSGKVRVALGVSPSQMKGPGLALYDPSGAAVAELFTMSAGNETLSNLSIWDPQKKTMVQMGNALGVPLVQVTGPPGTEAAISMGIGQGAPNIKIRDDQGFEMHLGGTETTTARTGQVQKTSADSIIMFGNDKDHHVIWKAP